MILSMVLVNVTFRACSFQSSGFDSGFLSSGFVFFFGAWFYILWFFVVMGWLIIHWFFLLFLPSGFFLHTDKLHCLTYLYFIMAYSLITPEPSIKINLDQDLLADAEEGSISF